MPSRRRFFSEGHVPGSQPAESIALTFDELEAIRLADFLGLYQEEAAKQMGVSRATFGRILGAAHKKVAEFLVQGKMLCLEDGPVEMAEVRATTPFDPFSFSGAGPCFPDFGPRCRKGAQIMFRERRGASFGPRPGFSHGHAHGPQQGHGPHAQGLGPGGFCLCPKCGFRKPHEPGVPCLEERCPHCGSALIREGSEHHRQIEERKKQEKGGK